MNTFESLTYAQSRLAVAKAMCDKAEIAKWQEHVEYWQSKLEDKNELAALRADNAKLREALENTIKAPHPTWCKSRQGKVCNCYQNAARRALEETSHA